MWTMENDKMGEAMCWWGDEKDVNKDEQLSNIMNVWRKLDKHMKESDEQGE